MYPCLDFWKLNPDCAHLFQPGLGVSGNLAPAYPNLAGPTGGERDGRREGWSGEWNMSVLSISKLLIYQGLVAPKHSHRLSVTALIRSLTWMKTNQRACRKGCYMERLGGSQQRLRMPYEDNLPFIRITALWGYSSPAKLPLKLNIQLQKKIFSSPLLPLSFSLCFIPLSPPPTLFLVFIIAPVANLLLWCIYKLYPTRLLGHKACNLCHCYVCVAEWNLTQNHYNLLVYA